MLPVARCLPILTVLVGNVEQRGLVMAKNKQRAVSILMLLGGILALIAAWDLPESPAPHVE
jgi:hypothetical protein